MNGTPIGGPYGSAGAPGNVVVDPEFITAHRPDASDIRACEGNTVLPIRIHELDGDKVEVPVRGDIAQQPVQLQAFGVSATVVVVLGSLFNQ